MRERRRPRGSSGEDSTGIQAHLDKDYIKAVHVLVPQIEKALVNLLYHTGGATIKPHQSGRGVMQQKSLNDVLRHPDDPLANAETANALGADRRVYLIAVLSHPKGLNIRNEICHGLWSADKFTKSASERVLHALLTVSLLQPPPPLGAEETAAINNANVDCNAGQPTPATG